MKPRYRVTLWESESGWGKKPFLQLDFETKAEALAKMEDVNAGNVLDYVPSYYIFAEGPEFIDADEHPPHG